MENKIKQLAVINNLIDVEEKYLTCNKCKKWLTPVIYDDKDDLFCCEHCATKETTAAALQRNWILENMLAQWKYPCMFENCDYIESFVEITKHMNVCVQKSITCPFCTEAKLSELTIAGHLLDKHKNSVEEIVVDEPMIELKVKPPFNVTKIFVVRFKGNTFMVITEGMRFAIGKQSIDVNFEKNIDKYMIKYCNEIFEARVRGYVVRLKEALDAKMDFLAMPLPKLTEDVLEFKIFFNDYDELLLVMRECHICLNKFTNVVYFCENHHGVCATCVPKITNCAFCQKPVNKTKVDLKMHLAQVPFPCPNATSNADESGCIALIKLADSDLHLANCPFKTIKCIDCKADVARRNIMQHSEEKFTLYRNFCVFSAKIVDNKVDNLNNMRAVYIRFKQHIFYLNWVMTDVANASDDKKHIGFYLQLLYDSQNMSQQYQYELQLLNEDDKVFKQFGNVCQGADDKNISVSINWQFFKQVLYKCEDNDFVKLRICISEIPKIKTGVIVKA